MAVISKGAQEKIDSNRYVGWTITEHRDRFVNGFVNEVGERGREPMRALLEILGDELVVRRTEHETDDQTVGRETTEDAAARNERDDALKEASDFTGLIDDTVTKLYGAKGAAHLGLDKERPRDAELLLRLGRHVVEQLPTLPSPVVKLPGFGFDPVAAAAAYSASLDRLEQALDLVGKEGKETDAARSNRGGSETRNVRMTSFSSKFASGLCALIGEKVLERKVSLGRRSGVVVAVEEGTATETPETPETPGEAANG